MKFCPECGKRTVARSSRYYFVALGSTALIFGTTFALRELVKGDRAMPAAARTGMAVARMERQSEDPQLVAMRKESESSPEDLSKLRVFAGMLGDKLRSNPSAPPELVFEAIDTLGKILKAQPNDPGALVMMADISFDQKAFTKALDFYERYLKLEEQDLGARSRYASTLTFLGRYDDSIKELNKVLAKDPKNFPAMAYLSITYAQSGNITKAKEFGATALTFAPSDDARARFSAFVSSLDQASGSDANSTQQSPRADSGIDGFVSVVRTNPVAGPKFLKAERAEAGVLKLVFNNFPMAQMPPFAKDKFFSGLKSAAERNGLADVRSLSFIDAQSGQEMERLEVSKK
jgi:tetratricopeptide (TPR) repeat protein